MSKSTEYTCDRCGTKTLYGTSDWRLEVKTDSYSKSDFCSSCVSQLIKAAIAAEEAPKPAAVILAPGKAEDIPF